MYTQRNKTGSFPYCRLMVTKTGTVRKQRGTGQKMRASLFTATFAPTIFLSDKHAARVVL
jgi:hypothetical protein